MDLDKLKKDTDEMNKKISSLAEEEGKATTEIDKTTKATATQVVEQKQLAEKTKQANAELAKQKQAESKVKQLEAKDKKRADEGKAPKGPAETAKAKKAVKTARTKARSAEQGMTKIEEGRVLKSPPSMKPVPPNLQSHRR